MLFNKDTVLEKIKAEKIKLGYTNEKLSELSGIPKGTLNKILAGSASSIKMETLYSILNALGLNDDKKEFDSSMLGENYGYVKVATCTPVVELGNCKVNADRIIESVFKAKEKGVQFLAFPELCITGYTLGDLFLQPALLDSAVKALFRIVEETKSANMLVIVGLPIRFECEIYDVSAVIYDGDILGFVPKSYLNSDISEERQFAFANNVNGVIKINEYEYPFGRKLLFVDALMRDFTFGVEIGGDLFANLSPSTEACKNGATIIANLSASEEIIGKAEFRRNFIAMHSAKNKCGYVYANAGLGESTTDYMFSGHNVIAENGEVLKESKLFENGLIISDIDVEQIIFERNKLSGEFKSSGEYSKIEFNMPINYVTLDRVYSKTPFIPKTAGGVDEASETILSLQSRALADRVKRINAKTLVMGISGGLDSTLALLVAVRALKILNRPSSDVLAVTMPCFGTTKRTKNNAVILCEELGVTLKEINISVAVTQHFKDIGQDVNNADVTFENAQARERTQVLMDLANMTGGLVVGTGDLSELALGWATYNGDHMSMYGVNASVPKTVIRSVVAYEASRSGKRLKESLFDVLDTPVSPELVPAKEGVISQKTEDIIGPYELHDFYLYYAIKMGFKPSKIYEIAKLTFEGEFDDLTIYKWLDNFYRRFFTQQFKRSCLPDGVKVGAISLSPRGGYKMPSDAQRTVWLEDLERVKPSNN